MKLEEVMTKRVVTITEGRSLRDAARRMSRNGIGSVIVKRGKSIAGILTERDLVRAIADGRDPQRVRARDLMSAPVIVAGAESRLEDAIKLMVLHDIKKLPVMKGNRLVGIVTHTDFARIGPLVNDLLTKALQDADARQKQAAAKMFANLLPKDPPTGMYA